MIDIQQAGTAIKVGALKGEKEAYTLRVSYS